MENIFRSCFSLLFIVSSLCFAFASSDPQPDSSDPLKFILGEDNLGPLKNGILNQGQAQAPGPAANGHQSTLTLAGNRTNRPDILRGFKRYRGGWDIASKHYWASVGFTGAAGFLLAVLWFLFFGAALVVHYFFGWRINFKGKDSEHSQKIRLVLLVVFTCASAIGCIVLSVGQGEFHGEVLHTLNYVVNQSDYTVQTLRNVTDYLSLAKSISISEIKLGVKDMNDVDELRSHLSSAADTLMEKTNENAMRIKRVFNIVRFSLIAVAGVMLLLSFLGLVLSVLGHQHTIYIFIFSGWLLVSATFILCGTFVIFNNAISDSCVAMQEWADNPLAETALSDILPCVDERVTNQTLLKSKRVVVAIVNVVNTFIYTFANTNRPPLDAFYYNQSGPLMPPLCYPFDGQMQDRECGSWEVSMTNASEVWKHYVCTSSNNTCISMGRVTPERYGQLVLAIDASYAIQHYTPLVLDLQNCNFVRDTFIKIASSYCPPLKRYLGMVDAGLALISAGIMLCLVLWLVYANRPPREEVFAQLCCFNGNNGEKSRHGDGGDVCMTSCLGTSPSKSSGDSHNLVRD